MEVYNPLWLAGTSAVLFVPGVKKNAAKVRQLGVIEAYRRVKLGFVIIKLHGQRVPDTLMYCAAQIGRDMQWCVLYEQVLQSFCFQTKNH